MFLIESRFLYINNCKPIYLKMMLKKGCKTEMNYL